MSDGGENAMVSARPASRTLGDLVDEMATIMPTAEAVVSRGERLDYAGLKARIDGFAAEFQRAEAGDDCSHRPNPGSVFGYREQGDPALG